MTNRVFSNIGWDAFRKLGSGQYLRLIAQTIAAGVDIIKTGNLSPLDLRMTGVFELKYRGRRIVVDCSFADDHLSENSRTFGMIREIIIRDCYLKHHDADPSLFRSVVDLGSNRGGFTLLACAFADFVLSIDCQPHYQAVLDHQLRLNGFNNQRSACGFIGEGGMCSDSDADGRSRPFGEILDDNSIEVVDFLKIDIEGSEFGLFEETGWLERVRRISMETHAAYGNPGVIASKLRSSGFDVKAADSSLRIIEDEKLADYLYAFRPDLPEHRSRASREAGPRVMSKDNSPTVNAGFHEE